MKAIIRFGLPPVGRYYTLPIFENRPKEILGLGREWFFRQEGHDVENQYILTFRESSKFGMQNQINEFYRVQNVELTEDQIQTINNLYFHMLDNHNLLETEIEL